MLGMRALGAEMILVDQTIAIYPDKYQATS